MNIDHLRNLGSFLKGDDLQVGTIGLMGNPTFGKEEVEDVLILACSCDEERFLDFKNKNGAVFIVIYTEDNGNISPRLANPDDFKDDWVYVPASKPDLLINPNTRRKSRFAKEINTRNSIYLSEDGGACLMISNGTGTVDLKNLRFTNTKNDRAQMMSVNEWGFFEALHSSFKPFWP